MELLFKAYPDQPSRLGVDYKYPHQAVRSYELLLSKGQGQDFHLKVEVLPAVVKLIVTSEQNGFMTVYKDVGFKPEQLRRFLACVKQKAPLQFVHVYKTGNSPFVAKPFEKEKFITVTSTEIMGTGNFMDF